MFTHRCCPNFRTLRVRSIDIKIGAHPNHVILNLIPDKVDTLLDYGCNDGKLLYEVTRVKRVLKAFGVDVDSNAISTAAQKRIDGTDFYLLKPGEKLPFEDSTFDVVTMLQVLEHVGDTGFVVKEISRVLKSTGILILSTPHKGLFAWADISNFKFRFPNLHRRLYLRIHKITQREYQQRFYNNSSMIGNVTVSDNSFHRHYSKVDLYKIMEDDFQPEYVSYYSLFYPLLNMIHFLTKRVSCLGFLTLFIKKLMYWDKNVDWGRLSYSIIVKASKKRD